MHFVKKIKNCITNYNSLKCCSLLIHLRYSIRESHILDSGIADLLVCER